MTPAETSIDPSPAPQDGKDSQGMKEKPEKVPFQSLSSLLPLPDESFDSPEPLRPTPCESDPPSDSQLKDFAPLRGNSIFTPDSLKKARMEKLADFTVFRDTANDAPVEDFLSEPIHSPSVRGTLVHRELSPEMITVCMRKVEKLLLYDTSNELLWRLEALVNKKKQLLAEVAEKVQSKRSSPKTLRVAREYIMKAQRSKEMGLKGEAIKNYEKAAELLPREKQHAIRYKIEKLKKST